MGKVIRFKVKPKENIEAKKFLEELDMLRTLYLQGELSSIVVIANGKIGKCCTSNGLYVAESKKICKDFIDNAEEYV